MINIPNGPVTNSVAQLNAGDIEELFNIKMMAGHAAAFSTDCDLPSTHEMVRSVGMQVGF